MKVVRVSSEELKKRKLEKRVEKSRCIANAANVKTHKRLAKLAASKKRKVQEQPVNTEIPVPVPEEIPYP